MVARTNNLATELLAFEHPAAGKQFVKGGVEPGESAEAAAKRELWEEAGLRALSACHILTSEHLEFEANWHFVLCDIAPAPEHWLHHCADGGGHVFSFFWQPLQSPLNETWDSLFHAALADIRKWLD